MKLYVDVCANSPLRVLGNVESGCPSFYLSSLRFPALFIMASYCFGWSSMGLCRCLLTSGICKLGFWGLSRFKPVSAKLEDREASSLRWKSYTPFRRLYFLDLVVNIIFSVNILGPRFLHELFSKFSTRTYVKHRALQFPQRRFWLHRDLVRDLKKTIVPCVELFDTRGRVQAMRRAYL